MNSSALRLRILWPLVCLLAVVAYLYSLGGLYIPHIGDEAPYIEIARLTAESSEWLPLKTAPGLENTKPPLLFWLGIVATEGGREWSLFRLRLPIVLTTFATAFVVLWLARRLRFDGETASLGALTFLAFYSSFQYGRPFLTNAPESLFAFLSFALVVGSRHDEPPPAIWLASGLALGAACLFKSFALVAPVGLALAWLRLSHGGYDAKAFLRRDLPFLGLTAVVALAVFALWPLLDPDPGAVLRHFVLEENLGKLEGEGYLRGLASGPYALYWLWLGHFGNAGLLALPLLFLVVSALGERRRLSREERSLWILVLSFLLVYSVPAQRQENYLIPTVPALAILLALRWRSFPVSWFRWFAIPGILFVMGLLRIVLAIRNDVLPPGSYALWQVGIPAGVLVLWLGAAVFPAAGRYSFHALVFASFLSLGLAVAPFESSAGRFERGRVEFLAGKRVFVPTEFISRHERHRFLLPGTRIEGYDPKDADGVSHLLESGEVVVVHRALGEPLVGPFRAMARRFDLRSRQTKGEMWRILFQGELGLLVRQEIVVRRHRRDRMEGEIEP